MRGVLKLVLEVRTCIFRDDVRKKTLGSTHGNLAFRNLKKSKKDQLLVAFMVDDMSALRRVLQHKLELVNGIRPAFKACVDEAFVVEVANDVHRIGSFNE